MVASNKFSSKCWFVQTLVDLNVGGYRWVQMLVGLNVGRFKCW